MTEGRLALELERHGRLPPRWLRMIRESIRASGFSQRIRARQGRGRPDSAETASTEAAAGGGAQATAALKRALDTEAAAARRQALSAQVMSYDRLELSLWNALPGNVGVSMQAG
jgi:hypothetical protein